MRPSPSPFDPALHRGPLIALIEAIQRADPSDQSGFDRLLRRYPKAAGGVFSKSEIVRGFRHFQPSSHWPIGEAGFVRRLRMKPIRTASGVAPVTVLTEPFPCPGRCVFCPSDVSMPKSYLAREPGAQRAAQHAFDPYRQTLGRLAAFHNCGHPVDKVELLILGGTWSSYPEAYRVDFVRRCFEAMNDFDGWRRGEVRLQPAAGGERLEAAGVDLDRGQSYNRIVARRLAARAGHAAVDRRGPVVWDELAEAQRRNEGAAARCVGLVVETRPDHLDRREVERIRRLGGTKVQIGVQSLSDEVLTKNRRGHDVAASRRAVARLRRAGFKIHLHWMPNLYGSSPELDVEDFDRLFADPGFRPDELKIYPCSLLESAELMRHYRAGRWRPYERHQLLEVLTECLMRVPPYCRVTRVIRDIPGDEIVAGNRTTNFRQVVEEELRGRGLKSRDIRAREIRSRPFDPTAVEIQPLRYATSIGEELFLQAVTPDDRLVGFCRLSLPQRCAWPPEVCGSALLREVHVYGDLVGLGQQDGRAAQHLGLGRRLVASAAAVARASGYPDLAVISAVGTRRYYRRLGFAEGPLYQHLRLAPAGQLAAS